MTTQEGPRAASYVEPHRPQYHFTPPANWMNDPNGLVVHHGEWHLFYQYNPFGDVWGHMSWGHAVSPDLVHWRHLPVAIPESDGIMAFSGCAVVDERNTSGFARDGTAPLVALYTAYRPADKAQTQHLAWSADRGRTWTRHAGNPVLDIGSTEFRDPKVFHYPPLDSWIMAVALAEDRRIAFHASPDLATWTHRGDFGPAGLVDGQWECPDLFELPIDGDPDDTRWVLGVNMNPGAPGGGSGGQYFLGRFDGTTFVADDDEVRLMDHGRDFYAAVSWSDVPADDGRRIWIGWMSNWQYAAVEPTSPWRGAQSLPRALSLVRGADGAVRLAQRPVAELARLRGERVSSGARAIPPGAHALADVRGAALEIVAELEADGAAEYGLLVRVGDGQETRIGVSAATGEVWIDRTRAGGAEIHPGFAGRHAGPLYDGGARVRLHVFVDWSSVEVFAGDGTTTITDRVFPAPSSDRVALWAEGGTAQLRSLEAWPLASAWTESDA